MPAYVGVIIAASVLVAAGIAAYESPEFQQWLKQSSQKVAHAFQSLNDDIQSLTRAARTDDQDPSTREDVDQVAASRRQQAKDDIMARSRTLHDRRKKRKLSNEADGGSSFDDLVDADGRLRTADAAGSSTAIEMREVPARPMREYTHTEDHHVTVEDSQTVPVKAIEPWESQYEQEMRSAWDMDLPPSRPIETWSHASGSLIDLTPTTEDFPDPDYSIPDISQPGRTRIENGYFAGGAHSRSRTLSLASSNSGVARSRALITPLEVEMDLVEQSSMTANSNSTSSIARVEHDDLLTDDGFSEIADGIRTPASVWTEVGSSVSGDDNQGHHHV